MTTQDTTLNSEIDFTPDGKHSGYIRLPHSVHRSAYGWLPIPVASIKRGDGPKIVLTAGAHGDEYEGQVILNRLIRELEPEQINGQIIILPMLNFPASQAGLRTSPIDDLNLNRVFPGDARGTPTLMIAHYLETVILQDADYYLDIHSGGSSLEYLPTALYEENHNPEIQAGTRLMIESLALPYALSFGRSIGDCYTTSAALRNGASPVTVELGGNGQLNHRYTRLFHASLLRMLKAVGCYNGEVTEAEHTTCYLSMETGYQQVFARNSGLFEPLVTLGDDVETGGLLAYLHDPATPGSEPESVIATSAGRVLCYRVLAQTQRGDCLFEIVDTSISNYLP